MDEKRKIAYILSKQVVSILARNAAERLHAPANLG